jgi:hypothetical protein
MEIITIAGGEDGSWMVERKIDCWTAYMLDCAIRDIVGQNFPWPELAKRN